MKHIDCDGDDVVAYERQRLIDLIVDADIDVDIKKIIKALDFAIDAHAGQRRMSNMPYICHPIEVAKSIVDLRLDTKSIILALLHDVIEDTRYNYDDVKREFGVVIADLVDGITKLGKIHSEHKNANQAENLRKLLFAMSKDVRVLLVKLADRLNNMETLHYFTDVAKRERIARETFDIYVPLAERIGLQKFKGKLQDLAFAELYGGMHISITKRVHKLYARGDDIIQKHIEQINQLLLDAGISAQVSGREKSPYSIWRKIEKKKVSFESLTDIIAFRIMVNTKEDCYSALGVIHLNYRVLPGNFQDYISNPKMNDYRSLHTVVIGSSGGTIEVQIRTKEMHQVAELGVAAHWLYKQNLEYDMMSHRKYQWIKDLQKVLEDSCNPDDVLENAKLEMSYSQVFCFTSKGDLVSLPENATVVDFAFDCGFDTGLRCVGAKVNGNMAPPEHVLNNADQVEVMCGDEYSVDVSWLTFVTTGKAKSQIQKFLSRQFNDELILIGRIILIMHLRRLGVYYNEIVLMEKLAYLKCKDLDDLLLHVARGIMPIRGVLHVILGYKPPKLSVLSYFTHNNLSNFTRKNLLDTAKCVMPNNVYIRGKMKLASCCNPSYGDAIVGVKFRSMIGRKSIIVHKIDCNDVYSDPSKIVDLKWSGLVADSKCIAHIKVSVSEKKGSLLNIISIISNLGVNIAEIRMVEKLQKSSVVLLSLELGSSSELDKVLNYLNQSDGVYYVNQC